jgi:predicted deacetylase
MEHPAAVSVVLHDVSPHTWPACERLLAALDEVAPVPVTLLVVADHHRKGGIEQFPAFLATIGQRCARGDEVVVHGLVHLDEGPPPRGPREWFRRRIYTAGEGEFAVLPKDEAARRLCEGWDRLRALGLAPQGFVAPAWLMGPGTQAALREGPFAYTSTRRELILLPSRTRLSAPSLVWSVRSAWRRRLSAVLNEGLLRRALAHPARYPLLRLGLHPVDADHPEAVRFWQHALREALRHGRVPLTKGRWVDHVQARRRTTPCASSP